MFAGGVAPGVVFESLVPPVAVSPIWDEFVGVEAFVELTAP